jgi:ABC-type uncharacterized transport system involved in gliding motility auxiliary subunit
MVADNSENKPKKAPKIQRLAIGFNVLVQIAAVLFILMAVNYYAFKHYKRWDFSRNHKYTLSSETTQLLDSLPKQLKIFIFFSPDPRLPGGDVYQDVQALLKEYQYTGKGKVDVEQIDPFKNLSRARALMAQYKFGNENVVVVDYQGHSKLVNATDMAQYDDSGQMYGQDQPKLVGFKGEQAITSAILQVSQDKQNKIYLIGGKGGPELNGADDQLALFKAYMERQNVKLDTVTLMDVPSIPDDASGLMLIGARYDLTDRELTLLHDYWNKQGRLFIALDPNAATPKLAGFLKEVGIEPQDDRVLRTMPMGPVTGVVQDVESIYSDSSPITKQLKGVDGIFMGQTQSLKVSDVPGVHAETLVTAAEGYWGETKYQNIETTGVSFDPKEDISAPLTIAASVEKGAVPDQSVKVDTARMTVTGNSDFLGNDALNQASMNIDFVVGGLNWLMNREDLIGIPPKAEEQFTLNLTDQQLQRMELLVMIVMPVAVAMVGGFVWAQRRR